MQFNGILLILAICCVTDPGWALKKKRQAGIMINDEAYYLGSGDDIYGEADLTISFNVFYDKPFNDDLMDEASAVFRKESKRVIRYMSIQIARNVGVITEDVTVVVKGFSPGSTVAEIDVSVPGYFGIAREELLGAVMDIQNEGRINGHTITKIEDLSSAALFPDIPPLPENVVIDFEFTYERDISDGSVNLHDRNSEDFIRESFIIREELTLHLMAKLEKQEIFISPDEIKVTVLDFKSVEDNTSVTLSIEAKGVTPDQLSDALTYLVIDDDVRINNHLIISMEELSRSIPYEDGPAYFGPLQPDEDVMTGGELEGDGGERLPPDATINDDSIVVEGEVMKDHEDTPEYGEKPIEPDLIAVPEESVDTGETVPPFPGEVKPQQCSTMSSPRYGHVECDNGDESGSVCTFTCQPNKKLSGAAIIQCHEDGTWDADAPYCIRIFCLPHFVPPKNGKLDCSEHNAFDSVCTFSCDDGYTLRGEEILRCQFDENWTGTPPVCEPKPINCEDEYGSWSRCENGKRVKDAVMVPSAGSSVVCPEIVEECVDCKLEWSEWGECSDGVRSRIQLVAVQRVGAGEECPPPNEETEECVDCVIAWGEWGACTNDARTKSQYIQVSPIGQGAECPPLEILKEDCVDCIVAWEEWSDCAQDSRSRKQFVLQPKIGAGADCPSLLEESEVCIDCVLVWEDWSECAGGKRGRSQIIRIPPAGAGKSCGEHLTEEEDCIDCHTEWSEWGTCSDGSRSRFMVVTQEKIGAGASCPELEDENEQCIDCLLEWGPWEECIDGAMTRNQFVAISPVGAGEKCPVIEIEMRACEVCEVAWEDWGICRNGIRIRKQFVRRQPVGVQEKCPELQEEFEECVDCVVAWGEWSDCSMGIRKRFQEVETDAIGAGKDCPELQTESEECIDCQMEWAEWTRCVDGKRIRNEFIAIQPVGAGRQCPDAKTEKEQCSDCVVEWGEWGACRSNQRVRTQIVVQEGFGGGILCPDLRMQTEDCIDCVIDWREWSRCTGGQKTRTQYVSVQTVGIGAECPPLEVETEDCVNCELRWGEWSECSNDKRSRRQFVAVEPRNGGEQCPSPETRVEACIDCVVEWGPWTVCYDGKQTRQQQVSVPLVGAGQECPPIETQTKGCNVSDPDMICRFTRRVLGYRSPQQSRDLLLIGDESGSIGWVNFEIIKRAFRTVAENVRGGIGVRKTQVGMISFARFSRTLFDFDDFDDVADVVAAIERSYFLGGYRSNIGSALTDANTWLFQQTGGMRSFPGIEDDVVHEILIATDGCRTADAYILKDALKVIKKRGIELYVLAIASKDKRCQETIKSMVDDSGNLFEVGGWDDLKDFIGQIEHRVCRPKESRADGQPIVDAVQENA